MSMNAYMDRGWAEVARVPSDSIAGRVYDPYVLLEWLGHVG